VVKKLVDDQGNPWTPADLSVLNGATFVVYQDANGNQVMDSGEQAHITGTANVATCTVANSSGLCDIGPILTGAYRITETASPANSTSAGDVNLTQTETISTTPVVVNFVNVLAPINIALDKTGPGTANVGDTITYTLTVSTNGPRLHNIVLTDDTNLCDLGPIFQAGDTNANGFLDAGETWVFTCPHMVTLTDPDPLLNQATVTGTDDYGRIVANSDTHSVDILHPDVTVTKVAGSTTISAGDTATFTITMTVGGDVGSIARAVRLVDALPDAGLSWTLSSPVTGCAIDNGTLNCAFGDLPFGATRTITVSAVTASASCGSLANVVTVSATNEVITTNNSATATIAVGCPDVTVTKSADVGAISAGDPAQFTIVVSASGAAATNVNVLDSLPGGVTWTIDPAVEGCSISGGMLGCTFGSLAAGASVTIHVSGVTDAGDCGLLANSVSVSASNEPAGNTGNNAAAATIVVGCPDVTVSKSADVDTIDAGDNAAYTIVVSNIGAGVAYGVNLVDSLPPGVSWTINPAVSGCSINAGTLGCAFASLGSGAAVTIHVSGASDAGDCGVLSNVVSVSASNEPTADTANNVATASITVQCVAPTIIAPANLTLVNDPGQCGAVVDAASLFQVSGLPTPTLTVTPTFPGNLYPVGTTVVTGTAENALGSASASFSLTVNDTEDPTAIVPADITVNATSPAGAVVTFSVSASDNCPGATVVASPPSGSVFPIGTTTVTAIATDAANNQGSASFTVTVLGAAAQAAALAAVVQGLAPGSALANKMRVVQQDIAAGDIAAACRDLNGFIALVKAQRSKKIKANADQLIAAARQLQATLGC
jgi:uncharacterized repeat protein (TIGR01451 family)